MEKITYKEAIMIANRIREDAEKRRLEEETGFKVENWEEKYNLLKRNIEIIIKDFEYIESLVPSVPNLITGKDIIKILRDMLEKE